MSRYPYLAHNLVRPQMSPIPVPNEAYDRALCVEWSNPYGVPRVGTVDEIAPVEAPKPQRGRPRKESR